MLRTLVLASAVTSVALVNTCALLAQTPGRTAMLRGVVVAQDSNQPVRKAGVFLTLNANPPQYAVAITDSSGQFRFDGLPSGAYELRASKEGYGSAQWGAEKPGELARLLVLKEGQVESTIRMALTRHIVVSGVVWDQDGDPVSNTFVSIFQEGYPRGTRDLVQRGMAQTDSLGRYRFATLPPGKYYISAGWESQSDPENANYSQRQFYGAQTDWRKAPPVILKLGDQLRDVDFHLVSLPYVSLQGRVQGPPLQAVIPVANPGIPNSFRPPDVLLEIRSDDPGSLPGVGTTHIDASPEHYEFRYDQLKQGTYKLTGTLTADGRLWCTEAVIDVQRNVEGVVLTLAPAPSLKGTVRWEGDATARPAQFHVALTSPAIRGNNSRTPVTTKVDGSFLFDQLRPGVWDIGVDPIPRGGYLKSMMLGTKDVLTEEMVITPQTDAPLNIVISTRGAVVEGKLEVGQKRLALLLAPVGKFRHVVSFFATTATDAEGKFRLEGLTPGKYKMFAFEQLPPGDIRNPDLIGKLDSYGQTLDVAEGAIVTANPHIITPAELNEVLR
ncbi:MAG: carboxypeptidase regulatory-like domain-containing protein [Bryobacteraceae bacterium]|nr:carboxypeptidase regulatory-like domain-containing protein [Bryobacteraceae bacterium]